LGSEGVEDSGERRKAIEPSPSSEFLSCLATSDASMRTTPGVPKQAAVTTPSLGAGQELREVVTLSVVWTTKYVTT